MTPTHMNAARSTGFTLIELMVAIAVLAVLVSIGVPAFNSMVRINRIATQTNAVVGALNYARSETATRGMPVTICAASSAARVACTNESNWGFGWLIFTDRTGDPGLLDADDELLQTGDAPPAGFDFEVDGAFVRFGVGASTTTARTFTLMPSNENYCASTGSRQITVGNTGRVSSSKGSC